jgi:3-isopropylmalate/(R)-2-methylmalate dehydratase small subunit
MIPGFADIFRNNSVKNGLLTIELSEAEVEEIFQMVERNKGLQATIDLDEQRVVLHLPRSWRSISTSTRS